MERYSEITEKKKREIVLLRGGGCKYRKCAFCDYWLDACADKDENFALNRDVLSRVGGKYGELEVINSGSVFELDERTLGALKEICKEKKLHTLHFESHYMYRKRIPSLREYFGKTTLKMKLGLETFDTAFRENVLLKGMADFEADGAKEYFDEINLLFGIAGQSAESMNTDVRLGLKYFERVCVNVMCENTSAVKPDKKVVYEFIEKVYPLYADNDRVDILINNTDFGVGG